MSKNSLHTIIPWFQKNKRDLPWRRLKNPYATWVSEIMLQQTQVNTVIPYFNRWMKHIPTIQKLSSISEEKLLSYWQGLGYYSRVRNLQKGAKYILENHDGAIPSKLEDLLKIPGIGRYTAGAILSLAFNIKAPIVDGNVLRVFSRYYGISKPIDLEKTKEEIYSLQEKAIPKGKAALFNEATMELGALVCTPKNPQCLICPLAQSCKAHQRNLTESIPQKSKKIKITPVQAFALILENENHFYLQRRPAGQLMGGLWEFPEWKMVNKKKITSQEKLEFLKQHSKSHHKDFRYIKTIKRHYTRFAESLHVYRISTSRKAAHSLKFETNAKLLGSRESAKSETWKKKWVNRNELSKLPLTSAHHKIRQLIQSE